MTYINRELDDIYSQYYTLCLFHVFLHFFRYQFCWSYERYTSADFKISRSGSYKNNALENFA